MPTQTCKYTPPTNFLHLFIVERDFARGLQNKQEQTKKHTPILIAFK